MDEKNTAKTQYILNTKGLNSGIYLIKINDNLTQKIIID